MTCYFLCQMTPLWEKMKADIKLAWEATDIDEPTEIVGIEIALHKNLVSVSQQKYVENILWQEHMLNANPVEMPLDPNIQLEPNMDGNQGDQRVANAT